MALLLMCCFSRSAMACNVPVFRYALERWTPDSCEVIVFHQGPLTGQQQQELTHLQQSSWSSFSDASPQAIDTDSSSVNATFRLVDVSTSPDDSASLLCDQLKQQNVPLPWVVIRQQAAGRPINAWQGTLHEAAQIPLLTSPLRVELSDRLLSGDAVVWLVVRSTDSDRNKEVTGLLRKKLAELGQNVPLPEGIGLPGSELFSDIPLLMRFTVMEVAPDDAQEGFLLNLFQGFEPEALKNGTPLVIPIFGRGRALEVIPADRLNERLVEDLTLFLCGACSCQVKERNPGFDLLMTAAWDEQLFGEGPRPDPAAANPGLRQSSETEPSNSAALVEIPAGRNSGSASSSEPQPRIEGRTAPEATRESSSFRRSLSLLIIVLSVFAIALRLYVSPSA